MPNNIKTIKKELREKYLNLRVDLDKSKALDYSKNISNKIANLPIYRNANVIMVYIPFNNEVDIRTLIEDALKQKKTVLVPKTVKETKQLLAYQINSWGDLELGNFKVYEPKTKGKSPFPAEDIELILIPGLAFDVEGYRLGYGAGYYDRFFARFFKLPARIGIAFDFQIVNSLPADNHDIPVSLIITENRKISIS